MTISYHWLNEYLPEIIEPEKLSKILTSVGLEVESMEQYESIKGGLKASAMKSGRARVRPFAPDAHFAKALHRLRSIRHPRWASRDDREKLFRQ